jgi:hypothetical protein
MRQKLSIVFVGALISPVALMGCAGDPMGAGGLLSANASKPYIYTDAEKRGMSPDGFTNQILLPSDVRKFMTNKEGPPTGEASYCDAGLAQLIQSRRNETLAAIAQVCGGERKYSIRRDGPGSIKARYVGNIQITPSCTRGHVIVFKCNGVEPKADMSK